MKRFLLMALLLALLTGCSDPHPENDHPHAVYYGDNGINTITLPPGERFVCIRYTDRWTYIYTEVVDTPGYKPKTYHVYRREVGSIRHVENIVEQKPISK